MSEVVLNDSQVYRILKRAFDIVASAVGLVVFSPLCLMTCLAVKIDDPGPAVFSQPRNGLDDAVFDMYKFRSMHCGAAQERPAMGSLNELDGPAFKMKDDPRITRVGRVIRKTSIDELPQLVNVLKGEMSMVGPRPLATYETAKLAPEYRKRTMVKPGLVCFWQVRGRSTIPFQEWMEMDFEYIEKAGLLTDAKILLEAIPAVITCKGAQ